ncbi:MAG: hypothetical protein WC780_12285 [Lentimicrobiaceae bacterium]|jgi:hypothetical protein
MKISILTFILALFCFTEYSVAQSVNNNSGVQDSLSKLSSLIWKQKTDTARLKANEVFLNKFQSVLKAPSSVDISLDSIKGITMVASDNGKLRIFTWNVPVSDGTNKYFGFIQLMRDSLMVIPLHSSGIEQADFETKQFTPQTWYGALYYKLIEVNIGGQTAYTLLGWDGYSTNSNRKLIDIFEIDKAGNIFFGMPVFKTEKGIKSRVVKEYAEKSNMLLRYDYQAIKVKKRNKIKKEETWLIVMDRLVPMDPSMKGIPKYYVASGDTYDGYIFRNGYWVLVEDVEVVNRENSTK